MTDAERLTARARQLITQGKVATYGPRLIQEAHDAGLRWDPEECAFKPKEEKR